MSLPLPPRVKNLLFRDIEADTDKTCDEIVAARPDLYGGPYLVAARNRYHYLKRLKANPTSN